MGGSEDESTGAGPFEHIRRGMRAFMAADLTGCRFAQAISRQESGIVWKILTGRFDQDIILQIDSLLDEDGEEKLASGLVFPEVRTADEIADLLGLLDEGKRWSVNRQAWKDHPRTDALISLHWQTAAGLTSSVLGMAPLGTMPVHRRAPYVALVVWPGGFDNPYRQPKKPRLTVSLADIPPPKGVKDKTAHDAMWTQSEELSEKLRTMPSEGAARHDVTFCLPEHCLSRLSHLG